MDTNANPLDDVKVLLADVLGIGDRVHTMDGSTQLLGSLPELDSMAVAELLAAIEERFAVEIDDADIDAEVFETLGSLAAFVAANRR